eukprot:3960228-Prymnesium_polylepis.1
MSVGSCEARPCPTLEHHASVRPAAVGGGSYRGGQQATNPCAPMRAIHGTTARSPPPRARARAQGTRGA